jgi:chromosome segregation ATPase
MAKDKNTPKNKTPHRQEAKQNELLFDITDEGAASPQVRTRAEFQEAFDELKINCAQWGTAQSELWEQRMVEHRDMIVESIHKAIEEKIQPEINDIDQFYRNLESEFNKHKLEVQKTSQAVLVVKDLQKNMSRIIEGFDKRFERLAQINKENSETIGMLTQKLEATEAHLRCFGSRMNVLDESLDEHEKRWMNWKYSCKPLLQR